MRDLSACHRSAALFPALAALLVVLAAGAFGASDIEEERAAVEIDGRVLFELRGISSFPASRRVREVRARIIATANDPGIDVDGIRVVEVEKSSDIMVGDVRVMGVYDADAELDGVDRQILAASHARRISDTIRLYRLERSPQELLERLGYSAIVTIVAVLLAMLVTWGSGRMRDWAERNLRRGLDELERSAHRIISAARLWTLLQQVSRLLNWVVLGAILYFYLNSVLGLFPWTRPIALQLFALILDPVLVLWDGFVAEIPDLSFLVVLAFITRYLLSVVRLFFVGVQQGRIRLEDFDVDWAMPTYKLVRAAVLLVALVVAYPYIPGSGSLAFQGLSVFVGVILSLGASSFISSMIAGLVMTYRGAFKEGEVIAVAGHVGTVREIALMSTRLQTSKNELITIANSNILNADVTNFTAMARQGALIIHTEVGIGYDTSWRQVEALLLEAARRTSTLLDAPAPFVLQRSLGDFAVTYELNGFTSNDQVLPIYSELHAHIQDVFNEQGVQIMSPHYEGDPATPKIVPAAQWYAPPAVPPEDG